MVEKKLHALFHAIESGNLEALVYLLKKGVDINMQNRTGQTALMRALEIESLMMVRNLVNHGADLDIMDDKYNMAIDYAKLCKNSDVYNLIHYKILYEELKMEQKDCTGCAFAQASCHETKEF
jgi:ankyrin repeat protein